MNTLCRGEEGLLDQMVLFQTYHNFVVPHAQRRIPCPLPKSPTAARPGGDRVPRRWRPD